MPLDIFSKEDIATEKRFWIRTTKRCNNHCIFCHDAEIQNGEIIETEILKSQIKEAAESGYTRLILSGGEPTIHPDIISLVRFASECGFLWIQIISNGRMFAYPDFTKKIIDAGLKEVTISFHSHNERIAEKLTDIKGSYKQVIAGINNLKRYSIVISIDIVINKFNVAHLKETIKFFYEKFGITEFDLLHLTPFGRAFQHYDELKIDSEKERRSLTNAIKYAKEKNIVVWTNRVPPSLLEGNEDYIQNPHKILDEIYGRTEIFNKYLSQGILECRDIKRCEDCFVREFCDFLIEIRSRYLKRKIERLEITDFIENSLLTEIFDHTTHNAIIKISDELIDPIKDEIKFSQKRIMLVIKDIKNTTKILREYPIEAIISDSIDILNMRGVRTILILNKNNIQHIRKIRGLELAFMNSDNIKMEYDIIPDILEVKECIKRHKLKISNLPKCISDIYFRENPYFFKSSFFKKGSFNLSSITTDFLRYKNYHKSLRCRQCKYDSQCTGMHINHLIRFGFKILKPVTI